MNYRRKILSSILFALSSLTHAQEIVDKALEPIDAEIGAPKNQSRAISLKDILEEGLRKNFEERIRAIESDVLELKWKDSYEKFWMPNLAVTLNTEEQKLGTLYNGNSPNTNLTSTPAGRIGIGFENYTLFNWGKDYLNYLSDRETYKRDKQSLNEDKRELKHQLIIEYFKLAKERSVLQTYQDQLRHASFLYRMTREKASLRKITSQEYLEARAEYLRARNEHTEAMNSYRIQNELFANLLGDFLGTSYRPVDRILFSKIKYSLEEAITAAGKSSPEILNAKLNLENSQRNYERIRKENLPLPEISLNLGGYGQSFGKEGVNSFNYDNGSGSSDVNIVATINMKWAIYGQNGLFNNRKNQIGHYDKLIKEREFLNTQRKVESKIRQYFHNLKTTESLYEIAELNLENARKSFDSTFENYMSGKTPFLNIRQALLNLRASEVQMEQTKLDHMKAKIELASLIGIEDFPGELFENSTARETAK